VKKLALLILLAACGGHIEMPPKQMQHNPPQEDAGQPPDTTPEVEGYVDGFDPQHVLHGWAFSRSLDAAPIDVALYVDGETTPRITVHATDPRPDVNTSRMIDGDHGFSIPMPDLVTSDAHQFHVFGIGPTKQVELGNSPYALPACATAGPMVAPAMNEYVVTLQAANGRYVTAECGGDDTGHVYASADTAGENETFYIGRTANGSVTLRSSHGRFLSAEGDGGGDVHANRAVEGPWEEYWLNGNLFDGEQVGFQSDDTHWITARIGEMPTWVSATAGSWGPWEHFTAHVLVSPIAQRHGVVRAENRSWVDDDGTFYPLGATMMWSLWGWKNDRDRLKQNLQWLAQYKFDYVRILGEVDWAGETIDPNWPDYEQVLGEFIDFAYDQCGLRVELTLVGGTGDPMDLAQKAATVINAGRTQKIMNIEVANESYQRPVTLQQMVDAGRYLRQNTPNLVALSSGEGLSTYVPNSTDWRTDYVNTYMPSDAANLGTIHMDRTFGDLGWRAERQPWDWKDFNFPVSHNEPIGPRSSVQEETDPARLAMLRAVGLINGVGAFVLHNGSGVTGQVDPTHNRPANLWEVPGIDAVMKAVRGIDAWMPPRAGEGQHWNNGWAGDPCNADAFWASGADHGVNRNYSVSTADGWISTEAGIDDHVVLTMSRNSRVEIFDILTGKVNEVTLNAGDTLTLTPSSKDNNGYGAFVIVGHFI
jgi:hypothetical protein